MRDIAVITTQDGDTIATITVTSIHPHPSGITVNGYPFVQSQGDRLQQAIGHRLYYEVNTFMKKRKAIMIQDVVKQNKIVKVSFIEEGNNSSIKTNIVKGEGWWKVLWGYLRN